MTKRMMGVPVSREFWERNQGRAPLSGDDPRILTEWLEERPSGRDAAALFERTSAAVRLHLLRGVHANALTKPLFQAVWRSRSEETMGALSSNPHLRGAALKRLASFLAQMIERAAGSSYGYATGGAAQWLVDLGVDALREMVDVLVRWDREVATTRQATPSDRIVDLAGALVSLGYGSPHRRSELWALGVRRPGRFFNYESPALFERAPLRGLALSLLGHFHQPIVRLALVRREDFWRSRALAEHVLEYAGLETLLPLLEPLDAESFRRRWPTVYEHVPRQALEYLETHPDQKALLGREEIAEMLRTPDAEARLQAIRIASELAGNQAASDVAGGVLPVKGRDRSTLQSRGAR